MKSLLVIAAISVFFTLDAQAQTCVFRSPNPTPCGDGIVRITIERGMGYPIFLLHAGDVHCWYGTYDVAGTLKEMDASGYVLLATLVAGQSVQASEVGRIQVGEGSAFLTIPSNDPRNSQPNGLQQRFYKLNCEI